MTTIEATADRARETDTGVDGAWDVDVSVTIDGVRYEGEVTLVRAEYDGTWSAWGQPDHWVSGDLLGKIRDLDGETFRAALDAIEDVARETIARAAS